MPPTGFDTRSLKLMHLVMVGGTLCFAAVIGLLAALGVEQPLPAGDDVLLRLSLFDAFLFVVMLPLALFLPGRIAGRVPLDHPAAGSRDPYAALRELAFGRVCTAHLLRLAMLEGSALLGLVVCLLAVLDGALAARPWLLLNAVPAVVLLAAAIVTFPSTDRLMAQVDRAVRG